METPATLRLYTEDESGATVALVAKRHRLYGERFFTMFEATFEGLATFDRPSCYWRTLAVLAARLDPIMPRRLSAQEVAQAAGLSHASAARGLAMLEADRVIFSTGRTGAKARRLNNRLFWKSNSERRAEEEADPMPEDARGR